MKLEEHLNLRPTKSSREDDVNPSIFVSGHSISTLVNLSLTKNSKCSVQVIQESLKKERLALKLNPLNEKSAR